MGMYGEWKGVPREQVPWYPTIDAGKCTGCRTCFEFCRHYVYAWDEATDRPRVAEPFQCVVRSVVPIGQAQSVQRGMTAWQPQPGFAHHDRPQPGSKPTRISQ